MVALVDDEDYEYLNQWTWRYARSKKSNYAIRYEHKNGKTRRIYMHRSIMNDPDSMVDHKDGNGLHNYKSNLRECTRSQNGMNRNKDKPRTSIHKGVYFYTSRGRWVSNIYHNNKKYFLGYFNNETDAAIAYNKKAIELFGDFARPNIIN